MGKGGPPQSNSGLGRLNIRRGIRMMPAVASRGHNDRAKQPHVAIGRGVGGWLSEIAFGHEAATESAFDQFCALLVLREILHAELRE